MITAKINNEDSIFIRFIIWWAMYRRNVGEFPSTDCQHYQYTIQNVIKTFVAQEYIRNAQHITYIYIHINNGRSPNDKEIIES